MKFELLQADVFDGLANAYRLTNRPAEAMPLARQALAIADKQNNEIGPTLIVLLVLTFKQLGF